jgi:tetratricopeptide (TPR) repeat protein
VKLATWFSKLFTKKVISTADQDFYDAYDAFTVGEKLWKESFTFSGQGNDWAARVNKEKQIEALHFLDKAIEKGIDESEAFSIRGCILEGLGFYFEALEDYNNAIVRNPKKGIASNFFMRCNIKQSIYDLEGSLLDIKEAIRLSKYKNNDNIYWDDHYKKIGYKTATEYYEEQLLQIERNIEHEKVFPTDINAKLKEVKRRERQPIT